MQINTKYNLGDIVYPIWKSEINEKFPCSACAGTGKVTLLDNNVYKCPNCNRYNRYTVTGTIWQLKIEPIIVHEINTSTEVDPKECYIMYRAEESDFYNEDNCFLSEELALAECDRRNRGINEEE
jgi:ribosomal protein L37AE/L43A